MGKQTEIARGIAVETGARFTKPVIKGTEVEVATILKYVADGRSYTEIVADLDVTREGILAALGYATEIVEEERTSVLREAGEAPEEIAPGITADRRVRFGRPVVKGTRVDVATLIGQLAAGESPQDTADAYHLPLHAVLAAVAYTHGIIDRETVSAL